MTVAAPFLSVPALGALAVLVKIFQVFQSTVLNNPPKVAAIPLIFPFQSTLVI